MCIPVGGGGGGGTDYSGILARQAEDQRQNNVRRAQVDINDAFKGYDAKYFGDYTTKFGAAYDPQIDDQYLTARKNTQAGLAISGNLTSSYGTSELAQLEKARSLNYQSMGDKATEATNQLRQTVQQNKNNMFSLANTANDPVAVSGQAPQIAASLDTPVAVSPLGDLFGSFSNLAANAISAERQGYYGTGTGLFAPSKRLDRVVA
jgi:hypothetical protein